MSHASGIVSRHVSTVIRRPAAEVYAFAAEPGNLSSWATGLSRGEVSVDGDTLLVDSPMGRVTVRFVVRNEFGVLDHDVTLPSGTTVTNPVRVLGHPAGSEVIFTVRQIELTDEQFEADIRTVEADLDRLKAILES
jgi:hypothetical protein